MPEIMVCQRILFQIAFVSCHFYHPHSLSTLYTNHAMKFLIKLLLVILYVPVFLIFIFAVNLRFQLLTPSFWDKSFSSESTYSKLSVSINKNLESQTKAEGGTKGAVRILTA